MTETRWVKMSEGELAAELAEYHIRLLDALKDGKALYSLYIPFLEKVMGKYPHVEIDDDYLLKRDITFNDRGTK